MNLDEHIIDGFSELVLKPRFDEPVATPTFHKEMWKMATSGHPRVAIAAPRGFAKSTAITHTFALANLLFRESKYLIIISDTEEKAKEFLANIRAELTENEFLIRQFKITKIIKDASTELIVQMEGKHEFKILVRGAEQQIRGRNWRGKRPDLIIVDDAENDEAVLTKERRNKLLKWFMFAVIPALARRKGRIVVVGTILHLDSLLEGLLNNKTWLSKRYAAHNEDFSKLLWPEQWPKEALVEKREEYIEAGFPEGYSQEYLNFPIDIQNAMFRKEDFLPMSPEEYNKPMIMYAAGDLAIGQKESSDYTCFIIGGMDEEGQLYIVDMVHGRMDGLELSQEIINIQKRWKPQIFLLETEKIDKAIGPFLERMQREQNVWVPIEKRPPTKDKIARAASIASRVRQGGVKFDKSKDWYNDFEADLLTVTRSGIKAKHDDRIDAFSWLGLAINEFYEAPSQIELEQEEWEEEFGDSYFGFGMNLRTGY